MRVYHERLWVPVMWWLLGLTMIVLLGAELAAGFGFLVVGVIYLVLVALLAAVLLSWGRPQVEVAGAELIVDGARLPLAAAGEVSTLDRAQTRAIMGPRADPAAFSLIRSYLKEAVYVEVTDPAVGPPYWVVGTRHPAELAAAINSSRPAARAGGPAMG
jgi:Protein of unknown function (DUF3093)